LYIYRTAVFLPEHRRLFFKFYYTALSIPGIVWTRPAGIIRTRPENSHVILLQHLTYLASSGQDQPALSEQDLKIAM
jgi:hypothetical protein